jgi:hypothetical protein
MSSNDKIFRQNFVKISTGSKLKYGIQICTGSSDLKNPLPKFSQSSLGRKGL